MDVNGASRCGVEGVSWYLVDFLCRELDGSATLSLCNTKHRHETRVLQNINDVLCSTEGYEVRIGHIMRMDSLAFIRIRIRIIYHIHIRSVHIRSNGGLYMII